MFYKSKVCIIFKATKFKTSLKKIKILIIFKCKLPHTWVLEDYGKLYFLFKNIIE